MRPSRLFRTLFLASAAPCVALAAGFLLFRSSPLYGLAAGGLFALAALAVSHWIVRRTLDPLEALMDGVQSIAAEDDDSQLDIRGAGQWSTLATVFNNVQRKRAQRYREVQTSNERLSTVLGSMIEGVIAVGADEQILLANDASRTLLDFSLRDAVGRPLIEVTRHRAVHDAVVKSLQAQQPCELEFEVPGAVRRVLALRATRLPGDPCPGVVVVLHDITELRRLENMRRDFMANVSHELKTPLSSIKAYAETLRIGALNDPDNSLTFIGQIEEQAERLHRLIQDLLQIARIESRQQAFEITAVPLASAVQRCVAFHQKDATAKGIQLVIETPHDDVAVRADEDGLRTILDNLLNNAIKYTPAGGRVTVAWSKHVPFALLQVTDTGIGISAEHQERIFERFYRVDRARSRELGGTGLGLAIVKHMTQAFGGMVHVTSEPDEGSCFHVRLPLVTGEPPVLMNR